MTRSLDEQLRDALKESLALRNGPCNGATSLERAVVLRPLSEVEPEAVEWIWRGRIPKAKLSLLVGDPGGGKSFVTLQLASHVTRGASFLDDDEQHDRLPASVVLWNGEDGVADTIRVRADLCGVDVARLHIIEKTNDGNGNESSFGLSYLTELKREIERLGDVQLLIIDPLSALLPGVDSYRDTEIRAALQPLQDLAQSCRVAIVCVLHLRKSEAQRALYRVGGSIGFVGAARSVLLVAADSETDRRAIVPLKSNLFAPVDAITFAIDASGFSWGANAPELTAERLVTAGPPQEPQSALREARGAILDELSPGELTADDLKARVVDGRGIKLKTFERARAASHESGEIERLGGGVHGPIKWRKSPLTQDSPLSLNDQHERESETTSETAGGTALNLAATRNDEAAPTCQGFIGRPTDGLCKRCGGTWSQHYWKQRWAR